MHLDTKTVTAVVREEKGVAARLVYAMKSALSSTLRDVTLAKTTSTLARTTTVHTRPTTHIANAVRGKTHIPEAFGEMETRLFERKFREETTPPNEVFVNAHLAKFTAEGLRQENSNLNKTLRSRVDRMDTLAKQRSLVLNEFNTARERKAMATASEHARHAGVMEERRAVERRELEIEEAVAEKDRLRRVAMNLDAKAEALTGIDAFEANLVKLGADADNAPALDFSKGAKAPEADHRARPARDALFASKVAAAAARARARGRRVREQGQGARRGGAREP